MPMTQNDFRPITSYSTNQVSDENEKPIIKVIDCQNKNIEDTKYIPINFKPTRSSLLKDP
jgi:hypothetical protein